MQTIVHTCKTYDSSSLDTFSSCTSLCTDYPAYHVHLSTRCGCGSTESAQSPKGRLDAAAIAMPVMEAGVLPSWILIMTKKDRTVDATTLLLNIGDMDLHYLTIRDAVLLSLTEKGRVRHDEDSDGGHGYRGAQFSRHHHVTPRREAGKGVCQAWLTTDRSRGRVSSIRYQSQSQLQILTLRRKTTENDRILRKLPQSSITLLTCPTTFNPGVPYICSKSPSSAAQCLFGLVPVIFLNNAS